MLPILGYRMQVTPRDLGQVSVYSQGYQVTDIYPHDAEAFTQGLLYDRCLYESTGLKGKSSLRKVELETGRVLVEKYLPSPLFAEGIAQWDGSIFQLTWKNGLVLIYDKYLAMSGSRLYQGEGWGLASDNEYLYMSDGRSEIKVLSPNTFREVIRLQVTDGGQLVEGLNALTFVKGEIFANVWPTDKVARIDSRTGEVSGWLDFSPIRKSIPAKDVLNGLAYDAQRDRLFVTGKNWPSLYQVKVSR